ncbi:biotin-independent malonate decarboxylase subunit gamma [Celerinatantimonas yamalensis]|uniref:Biotin-independent malonate decarboxylase subunit gamma n=1 Tax=Celerinatantimonas yamalensis TaxID=559956 RepID=A0ABW9G5H4_9GAMM
MTTQSTRGALWFEKLTDGQPCNRDFCPSVQVADILLGEQTTRFIAVVADANNKFPRAVGGQVGILEGWNLAKAVTEAIQADADKAEKRAIVAIIDVPSQAYGRREEGFAIHQSLAGAAGAYAKARLAGHPVIGLIVGKAMSGAFLAHGYQANRLIALKDNFVEVHAMGKESAARITLRSVESLEKLAATIPPMAYDIKNYASLGLLDELLEVSHPDQPSDQDLTTIRNSLVTQIKDARLAGPSLANRLGADNRRSSSTVRELMRQQWSD